MSIESDTRGIVGELCAHIAGTNARTLPAEVAAKAKHHILDTIASMVSGAELEPGRMAIKYARALGGKREALVIGTRYQTTAINAALANAMSAHADETDDSHLVARAHIGCSVVPAALAMAEKEARGGEALLRAVVLGYDVGARFNLALNLGGIQTYALCTHSHGPSFGAAAAGAALAGVNAEQARYLLAYAAQQASGLKTYMRDLEHIEKAFIFGGMPARNGMTSATMAAAGFSGIPDDVDGRDGYLEAFSDDPRPDELVAELGQRFEVMRTSIKKWSVGSPIQAALDSIEALIGEHGLKAADISAIVARLPDDRAYIVDNRDMPDICLQHLIAVTLLDGCPDEGDDDGALDPGESPVVEVSLVNVGASGATGISATLEATNTGVSVPDPTQPVADLSAPGSQTTVPFRIQVEPDLGCTTSIVCPPIDTRIYGIDPAGTVESFVFDLGERTSVPTPGDLPSGGPDGLAVSSSTRAFWVNGFGLDLIHEFDPSTGALIPGPFPVASPGTPGGTDGLAAVSSGSLFTLNFGESALDEIDTTTGALV